MKTEYQTRKQIIDVALATSGWNIKDPTQVVEEFDILVMQVDTQSETVSRYNGHQFSDYVLLGKNGKPIAVVDVRKPRKSPALSQEKSLATIAGQMSNKTRIKALLV
jgi:type I restriction enzyme R subunit